ncbi:MAG: ABC transporter permease [Patescibacteria group bacterium]
MAGLSAIVSKMTDTLFLAIRSLWVNKLRSFLTLLGIIIGIYAVVTLLSVARGVQKQTTGFIEGLGPTTILIIPGEQAEEGKINFLTQFAPSTLTNSDVGELKLKADLIEKEIDFATFLGGVLKFGSSKINGIPVGASAGSQEFFGIETLTGRSISQTDINDKKPVIFLPKAVTDKLGIRVGDKVSLGNRELEVIGSYEIKSAASFDPSGSSLFLIPVSLAQEINNSPQLHRIVTRAKDANQVAAARDQVEEVLTNKHGATDFSVQLPSDLLKVFNQITDIMTYLVVGIASISLLVSGIGISNIMLVTVTERTREIGIRKAVGATEGAILLQFLVEAVVLTTVGAVIGIALAAVTGALLTKFSPLEPSLTGQSIGLALAMGATTGIIFGLFPAFRAARKNPVEALRFE